MAGTDIGLALLYVPRDRRGSIAELFAIDAALGNVVRSTRDYMVGRIRLAWWRERLLEIDQGIVEPEPQLEAAAQLVAQTPVTGKMLASLAEGWEPLLNPFPWPADTPGLVSGRGYRLFQMAARILGEEGENEERAGVAGAIWAMVDVAKKCTDKGSGEHLLLSARQVADAWQETIVPPAIRPLVMLGLLARRDLQGWPEMEPEGHPARAWVMIRHRLTGRI